MKINTHNNILTMCAWERSKAIFILNYAENVLKMDLDENTILAVNPGSGYTYLWSENYDFCLCMRINCELQQSDIYIMYTDMNNGEEFEQSCENIYSINDCYSFVRECSKSTEQ